MSNSQPMSKNGFEKLQNELKKLVKVERREVIKDISEARAHGDLSENAEYHAAKERQSLIEGRIQLLNTKLATANVIDISKLSGNKIIFGSTVTMIDVEKDEEKIYTILGEEEVNVKENKISYSSPIAKALIGKTIGDVVTIPIPKGIIEVEVLKIEFRF